MQPSLRGCAAQVGPAGFASRHVQPMQRSGFHGLSVPVCMCVSVCACVCMHVSERGVGEEREGNRRVGEEAWP